MRNTPEVCPESALGRGPRKLGLVLATLLAALLLAAPVRAELPRSAPPARSATTKAPVKAAPPANKASVQRLTFDDDEVNALVERGDGELVEVRRQPVQSSLVTVRSDFLPELIKSAEDI